MSQPQPDWPKLRDAVLKRLRVNWAAKSETMRTLPTYQMQDPDTMESIMLSPNEYIREVEHLTEIGKKIIVAESSKINRVAQ